MKMKVELCLSARGCVLILYYALTSTSVPFPFNRATLIKDALMRCHGSGVLDYC